MLPFRRHPENPIVVPGEYAWRAATVFNPAVVHEGGKFRLWERAAGSLRPFICAIGLRESEDGVHFRAVGSEPVLTPAQLGSEYGSVQDPRVVRIDGRLLMTVAYRPFAWSSHPTGVGVPESFQTEFPGFSGNPDENLTRSAILASEDGIRWELVAWTNPPELDDRDVILFPQRIRGRYGLLRRPLAWHGPEWGGVLGPSIWYCESDDLVHWDEPKLVAGPEFDWESNRIGASTPPIRTEAGWIVLTHGVEDRDPARRTVVYRVGALLLDPDEPWRVLARTPESIFEPEAYYERFGLYIPNVVFPTAAVVVGEDLWMYYGVCDTAIALATLPVSKLVDHLLELRG